MRVRVSGCGGLLRVGDRLVWDDHLSHRQLALADGVERVLGWFRTWRELGSIRAADPDVRTGEWLERAAEALLDRDILVAEGSDRDRTEQEIAREWAGWGPHAPAFYFGTRSHRSALYITDAEDAARLAAKLTTDPPPVPFRRFPGSSTVALPDVDRGLLSGRDFVDVLRQRRSHRMFGRAELDLGTLATLLKLAAGPLSHKDGALAAESGSVFKTSPSGGARHPTEFYVYALRVRDLAPGLYHYAADTHLLEDLDRRATPEFLVAACGDQEWVADASALVFYTSVRARSAWKYDMGRALRILFLDVGHLSQTVYLLAAALGLRVTFTAALRDESVEELLGCDPVREIIIGTSVLGTEP
ncbi:SagB/ThcOx family dehydrogenase [Dactylosporangium sucinum]|uniref:Dehydrogenase n=1 Tax=Dactylosporangium sucinum TaxID=1424081 RepID=A0A917T799_9ACTN|nr:SagB/ThcOx family dehydrogenase [Dactylosporangium sucinum]GGM12055.1 dehydrogenase [Dactylosporangium sucinum]